MSTYYFMVVPPAYDLTGLSGNQSDILESVRSLFELIITNDYPHMTIKQNKETIMISPIKYEQQNYFSIMGKSIKSKYPGTLCVLNLGGKPIYVN